MRFEDLKTGDIFVLNGIKYMRTNNFVDYYDNAIILYSKRKGRLVKFYYGDEIEFVEEYLNE